MASSHEIIIGEVLNYLRLNLSEPLDLEKVAGQVSCSKSWLVKVFVKYTGKGPFAHLFEFRIQKAKELLRSTNLSITEIAIASGFGSLAYFGIAFRKATKTSPSEFRQSARETFPAKDRARKRRSSPESWFRDPMSVDALSGRWCPVKGKWEQESGSVCGSGEAVYTLELTSLLPENFQLSFDINVGNTRGVATENFELQLCDRIGHSAFHSALMHDIHGVECVLRRRNVLAAENAAARIRERTWHRIGLVLNDDSLLLSIDGKEQLKFRDPFPAPYEKRCRFRLSGYRGQLHLRNVQIDDLGFLPFARAVRQADALYNTGLLGPARQQYERMLETQSSPADTTELCSKVAICCLEQGDYAAAREWAQKVPSLPAADFWVQQAALVLLQSEWREFRIAEMKARILSLSKRSQIRYQLKGVVQQAATDFHLRGFFEEGLMLRNILCEIEEPDSIQALGSMALMCESLIALNRIDFAITHLAELANRVRIARYRNEYWHFTLADACNIAGRITESRRVVREIQERACDEVTLARCEIYKAFCLQAEGLQQEAFAVMSAVPAEHPKAKDLSDYATLCAAHILVSLGKPDDALGMIAEIEKSRQPAWHLAMGTRSRYRFPPLLVKEEYELAAEVLLTDSRVDDANVAHHAQQAVEAALILALAGQRSESCRILGEAQKRFPEIRVRYYAGLAGALQRALENSATQPWSTEIVERIENLPYPFRERGEVLYLSGLFLMKSGENAAGHRLLSRIAQEDHSNGWPAVLARKQLASYE